MDSFRLPLFLFPEEIWRRIMVFLHLLDLGAFRLACSDFYRITHSYFNQEYNTILREKKSKKITTLIPSYYSQYQMGIKYMYALFSINDKVLLYDRPLKDFERVISFSPFLTTIRSYEDFLRILNLMDHLYEEPLNRENSLEEELEEYSRNYIIKERCDAILEKVNRHSVLTEEQQRIYDRIQLVWMVETNSQHKEAFIDLKKYSDIWENIVERVKESHPYASLSIDEMQSMQCITIEFNFPIRRNYAKYLL